MKRFFIRRSVPFAEGIKMNRIREGIDRQQHRAANWMQERTAGWSTRTLLIALIAFGALSSIPSAYLIWTAVSGKHPLHFIIPIRAPFIINDTLPVRPSDSALLSHKKVKDIPY